MNEENTQQQNIESSIENDWKKSLCTVTPLSKYFAMVLFIVLPFLGFWGGRLFEQALAIHSGESCETCENRLWQCERAKVVESRSDVETKEEAFKTFSDQDTGVSFTYPSAWGEVTIQNERGECAESLQDPCNMRTYSFEDLVEGGVFLVMETHGHEENPVGRGAFWGDDIGSITETFTEACSNESSCELFTNDEGVVFAKRTMEVFDWNMEEDSEPTDSMYDTYSDAGFYYAVRLSPLHIKNAGESIVKDFESTVVASLKLEKKL
jgi:hypothetical protein